MLTFEKITSSLQLGPEHEVWQENFQLDTRSELSIMDARTLDQRLAFIEMSVEPAKALRRAWSQISKSLSLQCLLRCICSHLFVRRCAVPPEGFWPPLPEHLGEGGALIYAMACLEAVPTALCHYEHRNIPIDVAVATFADLELWMREGYEKNGKWSLSESGWLMLHFRANLFALGRFQYEPIRFDPSMYGDADVSPLSEGDDLLNVHIPAVGSMTHEMCDDSFDRASVFFNKHYPERKFVAFICTSWLMDRQLAEYLPDSSNIVRFLKRFEPLMLKDATDEQMMQRVFGGPPTDLDVAPQDTSLQRAIIEHMRQGRRWKMGAGYIFRRR